jgi:hypothetical protein
MVIATPDQHPEPIRAANDDCDLRCLCGALLARMVEGGVEIKCRRCKRVVIVPLTAAAEGARSGDDL